MEKDIEDMIHRSDFVCWALLKFIGSERNGTSKTCKIELASAFDVEYTLLNEMMFLGSDEEENEDEQKVGTGEKSDISILNKTNVDTPIDVISTLPSDDNLDVEQSEND